MPPAIERPLKQRQAKTVFLRVPSPVWPLVSGGRVHEFRAAVGNAPQLWKVPLPSLAVLYRRQLSIPRYDFRLMLLEGVRQEALGAITNEGLRLAGYEGDAAMSRFRRDWTIHEKRRFEPLRRVFVYTVRPFTESERFEVGDALVHHLYGDFLDARERPRSTAA